MNERPKEIHMFTNNKKNRPHPWLYADLHSRTVLFSGLCLPLPELHADWLAVTNRNHYSPRGLKAGGFSLACGGGERGWASTTEALRDPSALAAGRRIYDAEGVRLLSYKQPRRLRWGNLSPLKARPLICVVSFSFFRSRPHSLSISSALSRHLSLSLLSWTVRSIKPTAGEGVGTEAYYLSRGVGLTVEPTLTCHPLLEGGVFLL